MNSLENAIVRLLRVKPFYGHFLLNLRRVAITDSLHAAGVTIQDGIPTLRLHTPLFEQYSTDEQTALLEHLIKHVLHLHPLRRKDRNHHDWDICCDLAINPSIHGLPHDAVLPEMYGLEDGLGAEEYYSLLVPPFDTGNLDGSGYGDNQQDEQGSKGDGRADIRDAATLDDHDIWNEADSTPWALAEEMVRSMTRDSLRASDGETPEDIRPLVETLLRPSPLPWRQVLRQFIATAGRVGRKSTWMREHRRFSHNTPGCRKRRRLRLLVGVDVSDSTNIVEMRGAFAAELVRIASSRDAQITVLYANSRIQRIDTFNSSSFVAEVHHGGGFTDLRPVFDYARTMHPLPAAVIYLTDGIGPAPEQMEFPTLWVLTAKGEKPVPWGVEFRLEV
jgi:predicted metal-dependent peptidase